MPIITGLIAGGAGLVGDLIGSAGQQATNATNAQINQANINAAMQRQTQQEGFNAQQAQIGRQYNTAMTVEAQNYATQMSDTQMQRRVQDLQAARLNPLLAVSQGGASSPSVQAPSAPTAAAGIAGQGSSIPMQNPVSAFGNLGGITTSSLQAAKAGAEIDNLKAQTDKLNAESGQQIPANTAYLASMTGLNNVQAKQAAANIDLIKEQIFETSTRAGKERAEGDTANWQSQIANQNLDVIKATKDALISSAQSDAITKQLNLSELRNLSDAQQSQLGKVVAYLNMLLGPVGTATGAAKNIHQMTN